MTATLTKPEPKRKVVGDDSNVNVKITALVKTATDLPIRWKERDDGTFVLQFRSSALHDWEEVPIIEKP